MIAGVVLALFVLAGLMFGPSAMQGNKEVHEKMPPPGTPINEEDEREARSRVGALVVVVLILLFVLVAVVQH